MKSLLIGITLIGTFFSYAKETVLFKCDLENGRLYEKAIITYDDENYTYSYKLKNEKNNDIFTRFKNLGIGIILGKSNLTGYVEFYEQNSDSTADVERIRINLDAKMHATGLGRHYFQMYVGDEQWPMYNFKNCEGKLYQNLK